jgi:hypothetical protein
VKPTNPQARTPTRPHTHMPARAQAGTHTHHNFFTGFSWNILYGIYILLQQIRIMNIKKQAYRQSLVSGIYIAVVILT